MRIQPDGSFDASQMRADVFPAPRGAGQPPAAGLSLLYEVAFRCAHGRLLRRLSKHYAEADTWAGQPGNDTTQAHAVEVRGKATRAAGSACS